MEKKYEMIKDEELGLFRIKALRDFGGVANEILVDILKKNQTCN